MKVTTSTGKIMVIARSNDSLAGFKVLPVKLYNEIFSSYFACTFISFFSCKLEEKRRIICFLVIPSSTMFFKPTNRDRAIYN